VEEESSSIRTVDSGEWTSGVEEEGGVAAAVELTDEFAAAEVSFTLAVCSFFFFADDDFGCAELAAELSKGGRAAECLFAAGERMFAGWTLPEERVIEGACAGADMAGERERERGESERERERKQRCCCRGV
jgi:hypothetical protein